MNLSTICFNCFHEKKNTDVCPHCKYRDTQGNNKSNALKKGSVLAGRYLVGRILGVGGFGITYIGYDLRNKVRIAIKEYLPQQLAYRINGNTNITIYPGEKREIFKLGINKFLDETNILVNFKKDINTVNIYNFFKENNTAYYIMDYIEGVTLSEYMVIKDSTFRLSEAIEVLIPIMDTLDKVHEAGTLHRDISPDNIYITHQGKVLLLDFGAAKYNLGSVSKSMLTVYKRGFAPIEQYRQNMKQGPCTDVYALAATFYTLITGTIPPDSLDRYIKDELIRPSILVKHMGKELEQVVLRGLSVLPQNRYQTAGSFKKDIINKFNKEL